MTSKLGLIIKREYLAKVRNRSFIVMTILSPLLMVGMIVLIAYLAKINDDETRVVSVLNKSAFFQSEFSPSKNISYVHMDDLTLEQAKDSTNSLEYYGLLYIPEGATVEEVSNSSYLFTKDNPNTSVTKELEDIFQNQLRQDRLQKLGVTSKQFSSVEKPFEINLSTFDGEKSMRGINEIKAIIGGGFGYAIMMFIIIYGGFVMRSVIEEKPVGLLK